ncbi:MAG: HepT-like ribonuclease domain-containing protein [Pseudomonadota bacterium]
MQSNNGAIRIRHMIEAAETSQVFIAGRQRSDVDTDQMPRFALVRAIEIIGEAASKVTPETRALTASVPWAAIISMRNRLIHAYFDVNHDILWKTVTEEIPPVLSLLRTIPLKD